MHEGVFCPDRGNPPKQERLSDAEDGDWDNCETVFNLDEVDATQPLQPSSVGMVGVCG